jgi:hypothetical protein
MFKILSWIVREVDFTQNIVWIDAHLRVLVPTHKDKQGEGDVYESLIFDKNLFAPQTDSPIIEYPLRGDLVSEDGPVYLANDWFPSLVCDRPVEVVTTLGVEFDQFDLPDAPIVVAVEPPAEPEAEAPAEAAEAPKPAWEPKEGDWVTITKPTHAHRGWVSPYMDEYDGQTFQFNGEFRRDSQGIAWAEGPGGYYFNLAWLSPAPAKVAVPEAKVEAEDDKEIQPATKVKILHPDCLGRTGTTSWENCPIPNCLFVWVDSEDPVLRVGAIPIHKKWLSSAEAPEPQPEAPQKPVKIQVTAYHIGKQVLVTHRQGEFISSFVRILKGITIHNNRPDIVEYAVGRSPTDCFHEILYINPNDPDSEYQIEPLDD